MPDITLSSATTAGYVPQVWSRKSSLVYRKYTVLADKMDRRWEPETGVARGDRINIPIFTQGSTATKRSTFGTAAALTFTNISDSYAVLIVDDMAYKAYRWAQELNQVKIKELESILTEDIGGSVATQIDADLAGDNTDGIDALIAVGVDNVDITLDDLISIETTLNDASAKEEDRFVVVSPASRGSLVNIEKLSNSLYAATTGVVKGDKGKGYLGPVLSFETYMSNNLEAGTAGKKNAAFQRECIALCVSKELQVVRDTNIEDGIIDQIAGYAVYGFKLVKSNHGRELDGK